MDPSESCDPRSHLHVCLQALCLHIRPKPTLPANPIDSAIILPDADLPQCGLQLPCKHCAFVNCIWTGSTQYALLMHISTSHMDILENSVEALQEWKMLGEDEKDAIVESVYHEAISTVTRQGAPLANAFH